MNRSRWLFAAFGAYLALTLACAITSSRCADAAHRLCLDVFTPPIQRTVAFGTRPAQNTIRTVTRLGQTISALLILVASVGLAWRRAKGVKPALLLIALAFASYAQCLLLRSEVRPGVRLYIVALLLAVVVELLPRRLGSIASEGKDLALSEPTKSAPSVPEIVALALVTTTALVYRFYALNQLPNDFDGEAAYFMACATSLRRVALIAAGIGDPWSPFGWLYYIPVYLVTEFFGSHLLSIRFVSAITGVVSIPLLWAFLRRLAGPVEALFGSALLCFALTDMFWSRTDVFPYHAPGLIAIVLAWCTYEAIVTERLGYFILAAIFMAISYHQFPSGQTLLVIPLGAIGIHAFHDRKFLRRCWKKVLILLVGALIWYGGPSLNILLATGRLQTASPFGSAAVRRFERGKTLWSQPFESSGLLPRIESMGRKAEQNAVDVVRSQFLEVVPGVMPHHEGIPELPGLRTRQISAAVAPLLALGVVLLLVRAKRPTSQVLLLWVLAGLLPGLLSAPSAHRIATVFPAFVSIAALSGGDIIRAFQALLGRIGRAVAAVGSAALFAGLGLIAAKLYLDAAKASTPPTVVMSEAIRPYLTDGTLAVIDVDDKDLPSELTYLFLDDLSRGTRPPLWRISRSANWPEIVFHASPGFDEWYYTETRLRNHRGTLLAGPSPKRVVFIVEDKADKRPHTDFLAQVFPGAARERHRVSDSPSQYDFVAYIVESADLREATSPLVLGGVGDRPAANPRGWWEGREARLESAAPTDGLTVSAGLWIRGQKRSRFRCPNAGEGSRILLDGIPLEQDAVRLITRGIHRIDIRLGTLPRLPLYLEEAADGGTYQRFPNEDVLGPGLAERPAFAAETILPYPGYNAPVPVASPDKPFLASFAVSPSGQVGVLWAYESRWKVTLYLPSGKEATWEVARPQERTEYSRLAFAGERIALLNFPYLFLLDSSGRVLFKKDLRPQIDDGNGFGANEAGEFFLIVPRSGGVHVFSPEGEQITTLLCPEFGPGWAPVEVSVPFRGPVGVLDDVGKFRVFENVSPREWRVARTSSGRYELFRGAQVRQDGWLFSRVQEKQEVLVFDEEMNRRIAQDPANDLSSFDIRNQLVGFDRDGNLYFYREGDGKMWKLARR